MSNPMLSEEERTALVKSLMSARRAVGIAKRAHNPEGEDMARASVDEAKRALGERGAVWWSDGAPDFNRVMARNTPYSEWYADLEES